MKKQDGRQLKHEVLTEIRKRAVAQVQNGESPEKVIKVMGFSRACIYNWLAMYRAGGWGSLDAKKRGGRPKKLSAPMIKWIYKIVTKGDPRQHKFPFALWTRSAIAILIERKYGIKLSKNSVGRLLAHLGITPQKPLWRAYQQDPELVQKWLKGEYPKIEEKAKKNKAEIWFGDESGLRSDYHAGTTWGIKGRTPVVETTGARYRLNMLSAVNKRGKMRFMIEAKKMNGIIFSRFLNRLMYGTSKKIYLILDGHAMHKSKIVKKKVESYRGRLELFYLPPYSPELNPDEGVWREVKVNKVGRSGIKNFKDMKDKALSALRHLSKRQDKIRSLFKSKDTSYAA
jgi:transposase